MSLIWIIVALIAALAIIVAVGRERIWRLAGPPDLGDVTFETLKRRATPNDALACPPSLCAARSDLAPPVFALPPDQLRTALTRALAAEELLERVASDDSHLQDRYVQRTRLMRFPDTIVVRFLAAGEGRSSPALYSRSQLGRRDLGANRARIERWLKKLAREAPIVQ